VRETVDAVEEDNQGDESPRQKQFIAMCRDDGQALVETGLLLALIVLACVVAVGALGVSVTVLYDRVITAWP
jgi:Flp pilus assembly pilin Flp